MSARTHWIAVAAALGAGAITGASIGKMPPALPPVQAEFALSLVETGWLASMFNTIAIAGAIAFGIASDRLGALRFCIAGLACMAAGGLLGALAPGAAWLIGSRVLEGAGYIAIIVSAPVLILAASGPGERGLAIGLWGTHMPIGGAAVIVASPFLIGLAGWRGLWTAVALAAAASLAALALNARHYAETASAPRRSLADLRTTFAQPVPWLLGGAFGAYTLQFNSVMMWLPTFILQTGAADATAAAMLTALYVFVNVFGNICGSWLVHHNLPRGRVITATFAITTAIFIAMFAADLPNGWRYGCVLAYGFVTGNIPPTVIAGAARYARAPGEAGTLQGLIVQCSNLGTFIGAPAVAMAVSLAGSWSAALWVILPVATFGIAVGLAVSRLESRAAELAKNGGGRPAGSPV